LYNISSLSPPPFFFFIRDPYFPSHLWGCGCHSRHLWPKDEQASKQTKQTNRQTNKQTEKKINKNKKRNQKETKKNQKENLKPNQTLLHSQTKTHSRP